MRIVTNRQMQEIDRWAQRRLGISGLVLMENAGRGCVDVLEKYFPLQGQRVIIFCGRGNNGGDGFVIGRHIANRRGHVLIVLLGRESESSGDARTNLQLVKRAGMEIIASSNLRRIADVVRRFRPDIVVDAMFGTGFQNKPQGIFKKVIELINELDAFVFAVDIPSGINGDTGQESGAAVVADATATMCLPKLGNFLYPGRAYSGDLWLVDIGIPYSTVAKGPLRLLTDSAMRRMLPFRMPEGNKRTFGYALVVAGGRGYSGAAGMAARATLKVGAGLVRLAVPRGIIDAVEAQLVEVVKIALPQTEAETIAYAALDRVLKWTEESDVAIIGPGITTHADTRKFIRELLLNIRIPFILDADGLNCIADRPTLLRRAKVPKIITPHPGELARMTGLSTRVINEQRVSIAAQYAGQYEATVVLKGAPTIVAGPDGSTYVNPNGNSGLATAGSGDVLVGMIGGLVAQGMPTVEAATLGVFLHGKAADLAAKESNEYSLTAGDLFTHIPGAINFLSQEKFAEEDPALIYSAPN